MALASSVEARVRRLWRTLKREAQMRHVLSPAGELQLAATMHARPLLAFDFDGTLAPIVARPDQARPMAPGSPRACASWQANGRSRS